MVAPVGFSVRMYNVGFGDCLLLSFDYGPKTSNQPVDAARKRRQQRRVLFDFGSSSRARSGLSLQAIADQIAADCEGRLDAIVVTHRHRDHLSGFGLGAKAVMERLAPDLVVRSWTEKPGLAASAGQPPGDGPGLADLSERVSEGRRTDADAAFMALVSAGQAFADSIVERARVEGRGGRTNLAQIADDEVSNKGAVDALDTLSKSHGEYLYAGRTNGKDRYRGTRLQALLPGVKVRVLGPPRPRDWPAVSKQASESGEFWLGAHAQIERLFAEPRPADNRGVPIGPQRWIIDHLRNDEQTHVAGLVRWLDDALNNTSVILLFEVGVHKLLFGGDAQIENWSWALKQAEGDKDLAARLDGVTLYKVGHHGSRNATPTSLFRRWEERGAKSFVALLSTKRSVHGDGDHAVPRTTLVNALRARGTLLSTDDDDDVDWMEASALANAPAISTRTGTIPDRSTRSAGPATIGR